jgi:hypothetical protein
MPIDCEGRFEIHSALEIIDGIPDLMVKFKRSDVINLLDCGDNVPVRVTGTAGTMTFEGIDTIRVIP